MKLKIYTYEKCGTCRKALQFLQRAGVDLKSSPPIPIRDQPPSVAELKQMLGLYDGNVRKLFNTSGRDYKDLKIAEKLPKMTAEEALALLASNGNLVKRPFLLVGRKGMVGFDETAYRELAVMETRATL